MTKEQEEAIERLKEIIRVDNEIIKEARKNGDTNTIQLTASIDNDRIAIETVLNLIQEQQKENERKDKIIDKISQNPFNMLQVDGIRFCGTDIKQYFK